MIPTLSGVLKRDTNVGIEPLDDVRVLGDGGGAARGERIALSYPVCRSELLVADIAGPPKVEWASGGGGCGSRQIGGGRREPIANGAGGLALRVLRLR